MSLQKLKLVTFDVTNTILQFKMPPWQYYTLVAKEYGFSGTEDEVKTKFIVNIKDMWKKHPNYGKSTISWENWWSQVVKKTFQDHMPLADLDRVTAKLLKEYSTSKCWTVSNGGEELLDFVKQHNITLGVISNFDPRLNQILENVGLVDKFNFIATSYDVGFSKPDKRIFQTALEMSNKDIKPNEALHIGDDLGKDYNGAKAAGWHALLVNASIKADTISTPHHVFKSLADLCISVKQNRLVF